MTCCPNYWPCYSFWSHCLFEINFGDVVIVSWCNVFLEMCDSVMMCTFCNRAVCIGLLHRLVPFVPLIFMIFITSWLLCRAIVCMMYQWFNFIGRKENKQNVWSLCHGAACMPHWFVTWTCITCLCLRMLPQCILIEFAKHPSGTMMDALLPNAQVIFASESAIAPPACS